MVNNLSLLYAHQGKVDKPESHMSKTDPLESVSFVGHDAWIASHRTAAFTPAPDAGTRSSARVSRVLIHFYIAFTQTGNFNTDPIKSVVEEMLVFSLDGLESFLFSHNVMEHIFELQRRLSFPL